MCSLLFDIDDICEDVRVFTQSGKLFVYFDLVFDSLSLVCVQGDPNGVEFGRYMIKFPTCMQLECLFDLIIYQ